MNSQKILKIPWKVSMKKRNNPVGAKKKGREIGTGNSPKDTQMANKFKCIYEDTKSQ